MQRHPDFAFAKIVGERHDLWRAIVYERVILETFVARSRPKKAASKFLKKAIRKHGRLEVKATDRLRHPRIAGQIGPALALTRGPSCLFRLRVEDEKLLAVDGVAFDQGFGAIPGQPGFERVDSL